MTTEVKTNQEELQDLVRRIAEGLTDNCFQEVDEDEVRDQLDRALDVAWEDNDETGEDRPETTEADYQQAIDLAHDNHCEAYSIRIMASSDGEIMGYRIMVAGGGPTVWVDTEDATVYGYWGGCPETQWGFSRDVAREIANQFDDLFAGLELKAS